MSQDVDNPSGPLLGDDAAKGSDSAKRPDDQTARRAEALVDRAGERIGHFASLIGRRLVRMAARAREEAEDIWAEAQEVRRRNGSR